MVHPNWEEDAFVPGDCSMQQPGLFDKCKFAHPWLGDDVDLFDLEGLGLENNLEATKKIMLLYGAASVMVLLLLVLAACKIVGKIFFNNKSKEFQKSKKE